MIDSFEEYWQRLIDLGWVDRMSAEAREANRKHLEERFRKEPYLAFEIFTTGGFVLGSLQSQGDYRDLLRDYSEASGGVFSPTEILDSVRHDENTATIKFRCRDHTFERTLPFEGSSPPSEFDDFVTSVLESIGVKERFYVLPTDHGDIVALTFMEPETRRKAIEWGLLPEDLSEVEDAQYEWEETHGTEG